MTMYAKWFYSFNPEEVPFITFSRKGDRNALLNKARAGDVIVFVATKKKPTSNEDQGRILGVAEIGDEAVRTEEVVDVSNSPRENFKNGKFRWPEAVPMLKAWRISPAPLANDILENKNLPLEARTRAVLLSEADQKAIEKLNWIEVDLPIA